MLPVYEVHCLSARDNPNYSHSSLFTTLTWLLRASLESFMSSAVSILLKSPRYHEGGLPCCRSRLVREPGMHPAQIECGRRENHKGGRAS